jgi:predicted nucleic acid-binding protein
MELAFIFHLLPVLNEEEIFTITRFMKEFEEFTVDKGIVERTIYVRKKYGLKIPDAIIVATAIEKNLILITADKEILNKVDNIKMIDPLQ